MEDGLNAFELGQSLANINVSLQQLATAFQGFEKKYTALVARVDEIDKKLKEAEESKKQSA